MTTNETEWAEARSRLDAYLRALGLAGPEQQRRILEAVLANAAAKHAQGPGASPTALVMNEMRASSEQWLATLPAVRERPAAGFVSLFAVEAGKQWPKAFLTDNVPADFQRALQHSAVRGAPDLRVSSMVPQPLETPLHDLELPAPLAELAKGRAPLLAKAFAVVLSVFSIFWWGNKLK